MELLNVRLVCDNSLFTTTALISGSTIRKCIRILHWACPQMYHGNGTLSIEAPVLHHSEQLQWQPEIYRLTNIKLLDNPLSILLFFALFAESILGVYALLRKRSQKRRLLTLYNSKNTSAYIPSRYTFFFIAYRFPYNQTGNAQHDVKSRILIVAIIAQDLLVHKSDAIIKNKLETVLSQFS